MTPAPVTLGAVMTCPVDPSWIDYNGHLRDAYYGLVFSLAVDGLMDIIGIDAAYRAETGGTLYVVEDHRFYLREVTAEATLRVETTVVDFDAKRLHVVQTLYAGDDPEPAALSEGLHVHVLQRPTPRVTEMPATMRATLATLVSAPPDRRAGPIGIRRKTP